MKIVSINFHAGKWYESITKLLNEVQGLKYIMKSVDSLNSLQIIIHLPEQVILVSKELKEECIKDGRQNLSFFIDSPFDEIVKAAQSREGTMEFARNYRRILPFDIILGFFYNLPANSEIYKILRRHSQEIYADCPTIVLCPDNIREVSEKIAKKHSYYFGKDKPEIMEYIGIKTTLFHELGHCIFEPLSRNIDLRLSEGLANKFAYDMCTQKEKLFICAKVLYSPVQYSYFYLIPFIRDFSSIVEASTRGDYDSASRNFYGQLVEGAVMTFAESNFRVREVKIGEAGGFTGFGSKGLKVISKRLQFLANVRNAEIYVGKIDGIFGLFDNKTQIYFNQVNHVAPYNINSLPPNVIQIPENHINFSSLYENDKITIESIRCQCQEYIRSNYT